MGTGSSSATGGKYSPKTTSADIMAEFGTYAKGKTVVVTGGNSGLGFEASRALAEHGADVIIACRNPQLGTEAVNNIKEKHPLALISTMILDLASLESVDKFVTEYRASGRQLHVLMNNAGVMACPKATTKDGFEMQFGVNHLGHFYLTNKLVDILQASSTVDQPARVVNLSSIGHYLVSPPMGIRMDDLHGDKNYDLWDRYGSSKMANVLFTVEANRRWNQGDHPVISVAVHPGFINETNLGRHSNTGNLTKFMYQCWTYGHLNDVLFGYFKNTLEGKQCFILLFSPNKPLPFFLFLFIELRLCHSIIV
jgi:retinol dehydrogenase-12